MPKTKKVRRRPGPLCGCGRVARIRIGAEPLCLVCVTAKDRVA